MWKRNSHFYGHYELIVVNSWRIKLNLNAKYGLPFFIGLLYLNQNFTCLGNNLEFNVHGNGHYNHLQNGCETFIVQTMATILIIVGSLWT